MQIGVYIIILVCSYLGDKETFVLLYFIIIYRFS